MNEQTILDPAKVIAEACPGFNDTLTITEGPYEGLKFRYKWVAIDPVRGVTFDYEPLNGAPLAEDKHDFECALTRLLMNLMAEKYESNNLFYNGGVEATPDQMLEFMEENYGVTPTNNPTVEFAEQPTKNLAQQIMQAPGMFQAKEKESAMAFLERLSAQGRAEMGKN